MKLFTLVDEWSMLRHRAAASFLRERLADFEYKHGDAFTFIDADRNGFLSAAELLGAFSWLGDSSMTMREVLDFVAAYDTDRDGQET